MALPILDGNQTSTTLATTVSGGAHYPNHIIASGTVTANLTLDSFTDGQGSIASDDGGGQPLFGVQLGYNDPVDGFRLLSPSKGLPISGTVTATGFDSANGISKTIPVIRCDDGIPFSSDAVPVVIAIESGSVNTANPIPISGTVKVANDYNGNDKEILVGPLNSDFESSEGRVGVELINKNGISLVVTGPALNISGTVTASVSNTGRSITNLPNGALTTRFGSVTTANTAQLTAAVTNGARKYLLAQNISAGTVTIGIGFSPTTTQGIQLSAGGGLSFDAFCPTGAVYWLGATTGANFTILEG